MGIVLERRDHLFERERGLAFLRSDLDLVGKPCLHGLPLLCIVVGAVPAPFEVGVLDQGQGGNAANALATCIDPGAKCGRRFWREFGQRLPAMALEPDRGLFPWVSPLGQFGANLSVAGREIQAPR